MAEGSDLKLLFTFVQELGGFRPKRNINHLLSSTASAGSPSTVSYLLDSGKKNGADIDRKVRNGETLLMFAARHGLYNRVRTFIGLGADPNITNSKGETALGLAKDPGIIDLLKSAGARL